MAETKSIAVLPRVKAPSRTRETHGRRSSPEYAVWLGMTQRCCNPRAFRYDRYGGRGITVCDHWRKSFAAFYEDMGPRPSPEHTIDRIDNDGNYEPGNCRWTTWKEQNRNTRKNVLLTFNGNTRCVAAWAEELGINGHTLWNRLKRGWSIERALTTPARHIKAPCHRD